MEWDHLKAFEAVARLGSLTAAARALKLSQSTISRRLQRLEEDAESPLLIRSAPVRLTDRGQALLAAVRPMVEAAMVAQSTLEDQPAVTGLVTIASVGEIVRWVLTERLPELYAQHPSLRVRLLADNEIVSLSAGEADLALRFARPERGDLATKKLNTQTYGFFVCQELELHQRLDWLGLAGSLASIPEQRIARSAFADRPARLLVEDVESLAIATAIGLGVAILPRDLALQYEGVIEVQPEQVGAQMVGKLEPRHLWMVVHRSKQHLPKVRAVIEWFDQIFGAI